MKKIIIILLLLNTGFIYSKYHLVKVVLFNNDDYQKFFSLNLDLESAKVTKDEIEIIVNDFELEQIEKSNLKYSTLINNYEAYLERKIVEQKGDFDNLPQGFSFGSMGGFYTLNEIYYEFDKLIDNSHFFVTKDTIGFSWEKNPLIAYCFGSKKNSKPEVLITALHHSREPATVTTILYFLQTLFTKAEQGDPEAKYLLENRRIWVIPVLNPDGYLYNQKTYPKGGGLWRKNRRPINDKDTGVDLNRNYGPYQFWNANNNGSSTNPKNETYRGPEPFSEPEIQALRNFCFSRNFALAINYHTYGGMLIYPYSALPFETEDSVWYRSFGMFIQQQNSYYFGTDKQTVGYPTRGSSDDWFYTPDSLKGKVLAFTPEASYQYDGFWPEKSRIIPIAQENYHLLLNFLWAPEGNLRLIDYFYDFDTLRKIGFLHLEFQNLGIDEIKEKVNARVYSISNSYSFDTTFLIDGLYPTQKYSKIIQLPLPNENFINGSSISLIISIVQNNVIKRDTISITLYEYQIVNLKDSSVWDFSKSKWGYEFHSDSNSIILCDSPYSNYIDSLDNYLSFNKPIRLSGNNSELEIVSQWSIEPFYDFAKIEISTNSGKDWVTLRAKRSTIASGNKYGKQKLGDFGFAGYFPYWNKQIFNLKDYLWKDILLRLSLLSDGGKNSSGWDIAQIFIRSYPNISFKNYISVPDSSICLTIVTNGKIIKNLYFAKNTEIEEIKLFDILGRIINSNLIESSSKTINIQNISSGFYLIYFKTNKGWLFEKLIVK
ncbi:MAG: M14 family zinc carboxypeptidase [Ignavibacteria bacterium]|nr:M14 family zinc carboxypeptidase [Ignavibacteria bacterium]